MKDARFKPYLHATQTKILIWSNVYVTDMPTLDKRPLIRHVTVALAEEQYQFLRERVDKGKALNVPDAIRYFIDKCKEGVPA